MGDIYVWTGPGAGKTTNALGLALRAIGHDQKVVIIQFLKGRKGIGEYKIKDKFDSNYEIHQFGTEEFIDPENPREKDYELAKEGLRFAKEALKKEPNLLILDELNYILKYGLLNIEEVLDILEDIPEKTTIVITGRGAPRKLKEIADYVNVIIDIKTPDEIKPKKGVQY